VFEEIVRRGQGSAQPNISGKDIETISIIYPSEEIISQFNILLYSLFEKIICNLQGSRRLATLRDTLLPKLMSGELKVNDMRLSEKQ
jgi:type I restriction enzyme S subunit